MTNREILFRGKNLYKDEWVYGAPVKTNSLSGVSLITELYHVDGAEYNAIECDIIPETVGQFTGLMDKNGTRIFEGDILTSNSQNDIIAEFYKGCFINSNTYIILHTEIKDPISRQISFEITGNIHDNPTT